MISKANIVMNSKSEFHQAQKGGGHWPPMHYGEVIQTNKENYTN